MNSKNNIKGFIEKYNLEEILTDEVIPHLKLRKYNKSELIFRAHEPVKNIYFLVEGMVEISSMTLSGNKIFINYLYPLEMFGDVEYVNKKKSMFDVLAAKPSRCIILPFSVVEQYLETNYHFWKLLAVEGNTKLLRTNKATILKGTYSLKTVLANYIIKNEYTITFNSMADLALQFNVSYRNLSRVIKELGEEKVIQKERKRITTLDRERLEEYSAEL